MRPIYADLLNQSAIKFEYIVTIWFKKHWQELEAVLEFWTIIVYNIEYDIVFNNEFALNDKYKSIKLLVMSLSSFIVIAMLVYICSMSNVSPHKPQWVGIEISKHNRQRGKFKTLAFSCFLIGDY